ncbi:MAG: hypothetical protein JXQ68_00620 [Campylobacterales bacterium]|nr:hypothetical protein [Campylobacterales bacterium]
MKQILILAEGEIAKHFVIRISKKRVAQNQYHVVSYKSDMPELKNSQNIMFSKADPTSFSRMSNLFDNAKYSQVFIILDVADDVKQAIKNIRTIDERIRIVLVNQWEDKRLGKGYNNVTVLDIFDLIATHIYDHLPNVPVIAKNVGLGEGEIMEMRIPFGSAYAFRHIGSIVQKKWKITAIYRDGKQIIPTSATMIKPNDNIIAIGRPLVLDSVYRGVNSHKGLFPEPFGKNIYLFFDFNEDRKNALRYIEEARYFASKLENKQLIVRIVNPTDFLLIEKLKEMQDDKLILSISYGVKEEKYYIVEDIQKYDVGIVLASVETFSKKGRMQRFYEFKKLVYIFGDTSLEYINSCVVTMNDKEKMESISSSAFDVAETFKFKLVLCDYDPEGDFENKKMIIEHYEALSHIFNTELDIEQKIANPIREISGMKNILQVAPFDGKWQADSYFQFFAMKFSDYLLTKHKHPKILVPYDIDDE